MLRQTQDHSLVLPAMMLAPRCAPLPYCWHVGFVAVRFFDLVGPLIHCHSLLRQGSGRTHRRFLFGMSSSEPDISPPCPSDSGSDKDSSDDMYATAINSAYFSLSVWSMLVDSLNALAHFVFFCKKVKSVT